MEDDDIDPHGGTHQHTIVDQLQLIDTDSLLQSLKSDTIVFCVIRYEDNLGLKARILDLKEREKSLK